MSKRFATLFILVFVALFMQACSKDGAMKTKLPNNTGPETDTTQPIRYLALGDSYTIGESVDESERWPVQLVRALTNDGINMAEAEIIAKTGWTTAELKQGIEAGDPQGPYGLVTLLIGVNNQYRNLDTAGYRLEFRELLQMSIDFADGDTGRLIVVSIPDYGVTPFAQNMDPERIAEEINAFNIIKHEEAMRSGVAFVDVTPVSRLAAEDPSLIAADGLHPSGKMYARWVELILPLAKQIVKIPGKQKP